jgi:hypothetical protein
MDVRREHTPPGPVVRISFGWLLFASAVVLALGLGGGFLAMQLWPVRPPLAEPERGQLLSTVERVTISPSTSAAQLVEKSQRSVVLIGSADKPAAGFAAGATVTNDGLIVTTDSLPSGNLTVFDDQGRLLATEYVGRDMLFGLVFLRVFDSVLLPFDVRTDEVPVAYELLAVGRSGITFAPKVSFFRVLELSLPPELLPHGIHRLLRGASITDTELVGSPLIDEEGKLAGLLINPAAGLALPADQVRESIDRVIAGKREVDSFADVGFTGSYVFAPTEEAGSAQNFAVEVTGVTPASPAAAAGLSRGDLIVAIADERLDWSKSVVQMLSHPRPFNVTVRRGEQERILPVLE